MGLGETKDQSDSPEIAALQEETASLVQRNGLSEFAKVLFMGAAKTAAAHQLRGKHVERRNNASKAIEVVCKAFARWVADATVADKLSDWLEKLEASWSQETVTKKE